MVDKSTDAAGKGRPTPTRKEAEAARKKRMTTPVSRKQQMKAQRDARQQQRDRARDAMKTGGDDLNLPLRERGPVRRFCRDYVDRRFNMAEFLLPILVVILAFSFISASWAVMAVFVVWTVTIFGTIIDEIVMVRGLKKKLAERFPDESHKGAVPYCVLRTTQLRRFRLPKPQIKRGGQFKNRY